MATRSLIAVKEKDKYHVIYCHWDGYPEWNGKILKEHYSDIDKIRMLISLGDLSALGKEIGEKHKFEEGSEEYCTFYHRDRGDNFEIVAPKEVDHTDLFKLAENNIGIEYIYMFENGRWGVIEVE